MEDVSEITFVRSRYIKPLTAAQMQKAIELLKTTELSPTDKDISEIVEPEDPKDIIYGDYFFQLTYEDGSVKTICYYGDVMLIDGLNYSYDSGYFWEQVDEIEAST